MLNVLNFERRTIRKSKNKESTHSKKINNKNKNMVNVYHFVGLVASMLQISTATSHVEDMLAVCTVKFDQNKQCEMVWNMNAVQRGKFGDDRTKAVKMGLTDAISSGDCLGGSISTQYHSAYLAAINCKQNCDHGSVLGHGKHYCKHDTYNGQFCLVDDMCLRNSYCSRVISGSGIFIGIDTGICYSKDLKPNSNVCDNDVECSSGWCNKATSTCNAKKMNDSLKCAANIECISGFCSTNSKCKENRPKASFVTVRSCSPSSVIGIRQIVNKYKHKNMKMAKACENVLIPESTLQKFGGFTKPKCSSGLEGFECILPNFDPGWEKSQIYLRVYGYTQDECAKSCNENNCDAFQMTAPNSINDKNCAMVKGNRKDIMANALKSGRRSDRFVGVCVKQ
jgi:hypothetical protein